MSDMLLSDKLGELRLGANAKGTVESLFPDLAVRLEGSALKTLIPYDRIRSGIVLVDGVPYYAGTGRRVEPGDRLLLHRLSDEQSGLALYAVELDAERALQDALLKAASKEIGMGVESIEVPEDDLTMQIGCVRLMVPTTFVRVERVASTQYFPVLRSRGSIKKNSGQVDTRITLQIIYPDEESINDPENGLRALIAMFRRTPFVPIYNRHLNLNEDIWAVCLHDLQVSTIAGFPRSLMVELVLLEFDWSAYLLDYSDFGSAINWTLLNWYVRRGLLDSNGILKPARFDGEDVVFEYTPPEKLEEAALGIGDLESGAMRRQFISARVKYEKAVKDLKRVDEAIEYTRMLLERDPESIGLPFRVAFEDGLATYEEFKNLLRDHRLKTGEIGLVVDGRTLQLTPESAKLYERMKSHVEHLRQAAEMMRERHDSTLSNPYEPLLETKPWEASGTWIVTAVQAGVQNYFARLPIESRTKPVYQYLGSTDHRIQMGLIVDEEGLRSLQQLFSYCQESARRYHSKFSSGFLRIKNPVTDLFGIEWVLIEAMVSQSIPGYPDHYQVELTMIDYDQFQTARMRGVFLTKSKDQYIIKLQEGQDLPGTVVFGLENQDEWIKAEQVFPLIDCYPDLDLPTWEEVAEFLSQKTGRSIQAEEINTNGGYFVDPDFYFLPPPVTDREIASAASGEEAVLFSIEDKSGELDRQRLRDEVLRITASLGDLSPEKNPRASKVRAGDTNLGDSFTNPGQEEKLEYAENEIEEGDALDAPRPAGREGLFERAFHDHLKYGYRGRMVRAFPTFHMFVIDEGGWVRHQRLWDNFYGFNAVSSIEVHHSRLMATGTCVIQLANVDNFIRPGRDTYYKPEAKVFRIDWESLLPLSITYDMIRRRQSLPDKIFLKPGARIHLRLGYGNNLAELPVAFNGTITDVEYGEVVSLVAQTDARELVQPLFFKEQEVASSIFGGHYPRAFLLRLLLYGSAGFWGRQAQKARYAIWPESINGVIHFGNPEQKLFSRKEGELGQNIYYGKEKSVSAAETPWALFTGEFRVPLMLYNKSIWDIGEILAAAVPNFVFAVRPFEMRSTIFYGKPWWDWAYGYDVVPDPNLVPEESERIRRALKDVDKMVQVLQKEHDRGVLSEDQLRKSIHSLLESITQQKLPYEYADKVGYLVRQGFRPGPGYWVRELKKTFSQWHIYTSADSIIRNEIRLSTEGVYNNVTGLYLEHGDKEQSILVRVDPDIYAQFQKGKVVHTELHVEGGWFPVLGRIQSWIYGSFARTVAMNIAAATLRDSMKDMYQGELVVLGDPTVWPYDTIYIADLHKDMTGTCFVKEVYHHFSLDTGFVTVISPDLACAVKDKEAYDWLGLAQWSLSIAFLSVFRASYTEVLKKALVKVNESVIRRILGLQATQKALASGAQALRSLGQLIQSLGAVLRNTRAAAALARIGPWAARAATFIGSAAFAKGIVASLLLLPVAVLGYTMVREGLRRRGMADRILVCNFLVYKGGEFSAGVDGATQLTVAMPEIATNPTFRDWLLDVMPGFVSYQEQPSTELMGEFGRLLSDEALRGILTESGELKERLKALNTVELAIFNRAKESDSVVLLSALSHLGIPYRRGGRGPAGLDAMGFLESVLSAAKIPYESSERLVDLLSGDQFVEVYRNFKAGDIILLDRNPGDGLNEYDQAVVVIDPDEGWGVAVLDRDLVRHGLQAGVRIVKYSDLYPNVPKRVFRYFGVAS